MSHMHSWQSGTALFSALTLIAGAATPLVIVQTPATAQTTFADLSSDYWARPFIQELANRGVISGFPDGSFRPNDPVTRAQFAAMVRQAFNQSSVRQPVQFNDVPSNYWAAEAIREAYATGFLAGYPGNVFRPDEYIPRAQALVSLANGLGYAANGSANSALQTYSDAGSIPDWARPSIAAATDRQIVVNYPNVQMLNPNRATTRAEVAAFIYQALVSAGQVSAVSSPYIVGQSSSPATPSALQIPTGTVLPVRYTEAERIYVSLEEPEPVPVTLTIAQNIVSANNQLLIPVGSQVVGEVRVANESARFYAQELVLDNGTRLPISATSSNVTTTENITRGANVVEILSGAALGAGAAAGVAAVTGDRAIATEEVLGGGALGALAGLFLGRNRITLIEIDPEADLDLTLTSPLAIR
ncbi:MAG: S-layer homology domain-containing protein [Elainellaceae cyanobacterium]